MHYVYVLMNPAGVCYKGYTTDVQRRIAQHNAHDGFSSFTHGKGPWMLVHQEAFSKKQDAIAREKFLKTGKGREYLKGIIGRLSAQADG